MDHRDPPNTVTNEPANGERLALAWDQFYAYCSEIINRCPGVRRLPSADREDCVQDVMMEIVRKFGKDRPEAFREELGSWIRALSRNKAADVVRRRFRRPEVLFEDGAGAGVLDVDPTDGAPELGQGEYVSLIWEALLSLDQEVPVTSYLVFYLRTIEGWSVQETAELFQISADQTRARCCRVKKKFNSTLASKGRGLGGPRPA